MYYDYYMGVYAVRQRRLPMADEIQAIVKENYVDASGELAYMTRFESYWRNDSGFAIDIPLKSEEKDFVPDKWYLFE